jgi:hypothetical protein
MSVEEISDKRDMDPSPRFIRIDHLDRSSNLTVVWFQYTGNETLLHKFGAWMKESGDTDYGQVRLDLRATEAEVEAAAYLYDDLPGPGFTTMVCKGDLATGQGNADLTEYLSWTSNLEEFLGSQQEPALPAQPTA